MTTLILLTFIIFSILIYYITNVYFLIILFLSLLLIIALKNISLKGFKLVFIFATLSIIFNLPFLNILDSLLIGLRLLIIYFLITIISYYLSIKALSEGLSNFFFFTKKRHDIELIIAISLNLIPIMEDELITIKKVLLTRNFPFKIKTIFKNSKIILTTFIVNMLNRIKEMELVLKTRGYD